MMKYHQRRRGQFLIGSLATVATIGCSLYPQSLSIAEDRVLVVVGASGEEQFRDPFETAALHWKKAFEGTDFTLVRETEFSGTSETATTQKETLLQWLAAGKSADASQLNQGELVAGNIQWVILIGHGTEDKSGAKFNLVGPDISAKEIAEALAFNPRPCIFINASSSSGSFINALSGPNRIVITATKSGAEQNYSRFAERFSEAATQRDSDLDHDGAVSLLEAFLTGSMQVSKFYEEEGRLVSEQALLDDNGDKKGTPASFFRGTRPMKSPAEGLKLDGGIARRIFLILPEGQKRRSPEEESQIIQLENELLELRNRKADLGEDEYYSLVQSVALKIAEITLRGR